MLYINLGDSHLEVIQTGRKVAGGQNFVSSSIKEIPEGIIVDGLVKNPEKLKQELKELFLSGEPQKIDDNSVSLAISDKLVFTHRLFIPNDIDESKLQKFIISEAKTIFSHDPEKLDNFYKVIKTTSSEKQVFYTAAEKSTIIHFVNIFDSLGLKVSFLTSRSISIWQLLKSIIEEEEMILYSDVEKKEVDYIVFDKYGPVISQTAEVGKESFVLQSREIIEKFKKDREITISKVILGGGKSIKINSQEVAKNTEKKVIKLSQIVDDILDKAKVKFDTGGKARMLFATSMGLNLLIQTSSPPNFAMDVKLLKEKEPIISEKISEEKKEEDYPSQILPDQIVEHKRSFWKTVLSSKIFVVLTTALLVFIILISVLSFTDRDNFSLPFISSPTLTPTPSFSPTQTPTPTVDPDLNRSDITVSVQNGTDTQGLAGKTGDFLEDKGYENVERKNADRDDYQKSQVKLKESKKKYLPLFLDDIKEKFDISEFGSLDEDEDFDVVLILGRE